MKPGAGKTKEFKERLKTEIGIRLTKRHVLRYIFYVDDIPYSLVGKKLEILVKNVVCGRKVKSNVLSNPTSLRIYEKFFHLEEAVKEEERVLAKL